MFGDPLFTHPAWTGGVHTTGRPHPEDDDHRDQSNDMPTMAWQALGAASDSRSGRIVKRLFG
jgi:hypothetical protein